MPYTVDSPGPVPLPFSLVVKNGSKMLRLGLRVHAAPRVAHRELDVGARASRPRGAPT